MATTPRLLCTVALLLAACGGGDGGDAAGSLASSTVQGWAADAQAMPLAASTAVQTATRSLEAALAADAAAPNVSAMRPLAAGRLALELVLPCTGGGVVATSISGGSLATQANGVLDAGESYALVFDDCRSAGDGARLNGALRLDVAAFGPVEADLTHRAQALTLTTDGGARYALDGGVREQRRVARLGAASHLTSHLTSPGLALIARIDGRSGSHELRVLDWHVTSTVDVFGTLLQSSHQGTLVLAVATPRRPPATLTITTQGTLVAGPGGLYASQGSFSVATPHDRIIVSHGATQVSLMLDLGNDGRIDRSWTLPRFVFDAEAG